MMFDPNASGPWATALRSKNLGELLQNAQALKNDPNGWKALKGKGGAQQPTAPTTVPTATGGFYQQQDPAARARLLQAMAARSRGGGTPGAPTGV